MPRLLTKGQLSLLVLMPIAGLAGLLFLDGLWHGLCFLLAAFPLGAALLALIVRSRRSHS